MDPRFPDKASDHEPLQVVMVDDDPVSLTYLQAILNEEGHETHPFESGQAALEALAGLNPDVILLDISMPVMDGLEVCEKIQDDPQCCHIPVIFLTGRTEPEDVVEGMRAGAVDYVTKPYNPPELDARVRTHGELKRNRESLIRINQELKEEVEERRCYQRKQEINIHLARSILNLVNSTSPRYVEMDGDHRLFMEFFSMPCEMEGGDHCFVRELPPSTAFPAGRTHFSVKDQSGHEVNCLLRSIVTDLMHQSLLRDSDQNDCAALITRLNQEICRSQLFQEDDFFTGFFGEINHATQEMVYASAGHPACLLLREGKVHLLPEAESDGANLPVGVLEECQFQAHSLKLEPGDRLMVYTDGLNEMPRESEGSTLQPRDLKAMAQQLLEEDVAIHAAAFARKLLQAVTEHARKRVEVFGENNSADDVTLFALEVEKAGLSHEVQWHIQDEQDFSKKVKELTQTLAETWTPLGFEDSNKRIHMVLEESVVNAWKHGNGGDPEKPVIIRWDYVNDGLIEVEDQGPGFDYHHLQDPCLGPNRYLESGRGIFMLHLFARDVRWNEKGNCIKMALNPTIYAREEQQRRQVERFMDLWHWQGKKG